jgi:hypothetical protein
MHTSVLTQDTDWGLTPCKNLQIWVMGEVNSVVAFGEDLGMSSVPKKQTTWASHGMNALALSRLDHWHVFLVFCRYIIPSLQKLDAGFYRCVVRNRMGALLQRKSEIQVACKCVGQARALNAEQSCSSCGKDWYLFLGPLKEMWDAGWAC